MANDEKAQKLAAMAQAGKAGGDAYDAALQHVAQMRSGAVNDAATRAGAINAPQQFLAKQQAIAAQPGDISATLLKSLQGGAQSYQSAVNAAQGNYISQLNDAQPVIREKLQSALSGVKDTAQTKAYDTVLKLMTQQNTLQDRQDKADAKKLKADQERSRTSALQELDDDTSKSYNPETRKTTKQLLNQSATYDQALKAITQTKDSNGDIVELTAEDWAKKGVDMQILLDYAKMYFKPKEYFAEFTVPSEE